jgi:hypothetical protein
VLSARWPQQDQRHVRAKAAICCVAVLTVLACGCGGSSHVKREEPKRPDVRAKPVRTAQTDPVLARLGLPALSGSSPLPGYLMIADRDKNGIIIVNPDKQIVWRFLTPGALAPGQVFAGPGDAFLSADHRDITTNEECSDTIAILSLTRAPRIVWEYGHPDVQGSSPGYLAHPDDAYLLADRQVQVAAIINCRVLRLDRRKHIVHSIGTVGDCSHDPPRALLEPNGDTPLADGGVLVAEIGGWIDRFSATGQLMWSIKSPTDYPSDAQLLSNGDVLVAGLTPPGGSTSLLPVGAFSGPTDQRPVPERSIAPRSRYSSRTATSPPPRTGTTAS